MENDLVVWCRDTREGVEMYSDNYFVFFFWKHTHYPFKWWLKIAAVSTESVCYDTYAVSFTMW